VARSLAQYAAGAALVRLADEGARVGLALLALQRTDSAAVGGVLVAALLVPHVVAAPVVGLLADRARRPQRVVAAAAIGFGTALVLTAAGLGRLPVIAVVLVLLAGGCCGPALTGALSGQLPAVVAVSRLPRAFGIDSLTYNVAGIAGPALAALAAAATSPATATAILGGCAALGAVLIAVLPTAAPAAARSTKLARRELFDGVRLLAQDKELAAVTVATSIGQLGMGALPVIAAVIAEQHHHPAVAGWLLTALAAGGLLGSLAWTCRPAGPDRAARTVLAGLAGVGVPLAAAAFVSAPLPLCALFALAGFSNGPLFGALLVTRNARAPEHLRSQVFTLGAGTKISSSAAGAAVAGLLVAHASTASLLLLCAACSLLGGALGRLMLRPVAAGLARGAGTPAESAYLQAGADRP
jgi:MFS family permease